MNAQLLPTREAKSNDFKADLRTVSTAEIVNSDFQTKPIPGPILSRHWPDIGDRETLRLVVLND